MVTYAHHRRRVRYQYAFKIEDFNNLVSYAQKGYKVVKIFDFKSILLFSNRRFE